MTCLLICAREAAPLRLSGSAMAIVSTAGWIGMGLGSYQAGYFYDLSASYLLSYANAAIGGILNLLIVAQRTWYRRHRMDAAPASQREDGALRDDEQASQLGEPRDHVVGETVGRSVCRGLARMRASCCYRLADDVKTQTPACEDQLKMYVLPPFAVTDLFSRPLWYATAIVPEHFGHTTSVDRPESIDTCRHADCPSQ